MTSEDGTHSGYRNVVGKFTSHIMQKPQKKKKISDIFIKTIDVLWVTCGPRVLYCLSTAYNVIMEFPLYFH
jgi:hypothetical protein